MANISSFLILILLFYGRSLRHSNKKKHALIMSLVIGLDLILVLALVFMRNALGQVDTDMHWSLMVHLPFAVGTLLLYFVALFVGIKLLKGDRSYLGKMRFLDRLIMPGRTLTFLTSVLMEVLSKL